MKKAMILALAVMLTLSLAIPAAAATAESPTAPETSQTTTAPLPEVVEEEAKTEDGAAVTVEPVAADKVEEMPAEEQKTFVAAQEALKEAAPKGMKAQYFFYAKVTKTEADGTSSKVTGSVADDGTVKSAASANLTIKLDSILKSANGNVNGKGNANGNVNGKGNGVGNGATVPNIVVKQFVDGKWVELETVINNDGTITIMGVVDGPIAIFTK